MRFASSLVVTAGLLVTLCAAADAAPARHAHTRQPAAAPQSAATPPERFAVPGWSEESTQRWLDNASSSVGRGG